MNLRDLALKFSILGVPVAIGLDFLLVMLLLASSWQAPEDLPVWMAVVTVSVLLHELGHAAVAESFEASPRIRLYAGGGVTTMPMLPPRQHLLVAAAGPAVGLILGGIAAAVAASSDALPEPWVGDIIWVNLGWGALNLLPIPGLDGGAILTSSLTLLLKRPSEKAAAVIGLVFAFGAIAVLVAIGEPSWAFVVGFLLVIMAFLNGGIPGLASRRRVVDAGGLLREGRYGDAYAAIELYLAAHPDDLGAVGFAADALRLQSDYENSLRGYEFVLTRRPGDPHALRGRICDLAALGRRDEAMADLQALAATGGAGAISLATALYALDLHADGYQFTHAPMRGDAPVMRLMANVATVFEYTTGRLDEALQHVEKALAQSPAEPDLHELRALILCDLGRPAEALTEIGRAVGTAPRHPEFQQSLGLILRMGGDARSAIQPLVDSAIARPHGARPRGELIAGYAQLGNVMEARAALETLPGYARQDPFVLYGQAALAAVTGAADEARRLVASAAAIRPELGFRAAKDPLFSSLASGLTTAATSETT